MSMPVIGMSVLIVDDDPLAREFAQSILEQSGFTHVQDLAGGLTAWESAQLPVEVKL